MINLFNAVRNIDQIGDAFKIQEAESIWGGPDMIVRLYTITIIGVYTLDLIASTLEYAGDPVAAVFRQYELYDRSFLMFAGLLVTKTTESKKMNMMNVIHVASMCILLFAPQYKIAHTIISWTMTAIRIMWIKQRTF